MEKLLDAVLGTIKAVGDRLSERIAVLEQREPVPGRDGRDGAPGLQGEKGIDGRHGADGTHGRDADPSLLLELKAEIDALRAELVTVKTDPDVSALHALVAAEVAKLPPAPAGQDADPALIARVVADHVAALPPPRDGKDVDPTVVKTLVDDAVRDAVAAVPPPTNGQDGQSVTVEDVTPLIVSAVAKAVSALPPPKDGAPGASVDPHAVEALVVAQVTKAVAAWPVPKDGQSVTVEDVTPMIVSEVAKAASAWPIPKDGIGVMGALIDRDGHLNLTLSDGRVKDLGPVVGKDVDRSEVIRVITEEVAKFDKPKDGRDGLGFEDLDLVTVDRGCFLRFARGDQTKEFRLPIVLDRGVFKVETPYETGDGVTWGGSFWIAQRATTGEKPGDGSTAWRLAVKRGSDGKDGKEGKPGLKGFDGKDGRDGGKW